VLSRIKRSAGHLIAAWLFLAPAVAAAQGVSPDLNALVDETQQRSSEPQELSIVWWLPEEFWRLSAQSNPSLAPEVVDTLVARVHPYVIVGALSGHIGELASVRYASGDSLRNGIRLVDSTGAQFAPLDRDSLPAPIQGLLDLLRPMMASLLGNMGQNLNFFVFDGLTPDGARRLDPTRPGRFSIRLLGTDYRWRLPLASLVPKKRCPVDGELLSGAWRFCPWHGVELAVLH
jgi:hypothetical protein